MTTPGASVFDCLERLLPFVSKPIQYIGGEVNAVTKAWDDVEVRWALMYPDAYEVGAPNQGVQILYEVLNERADVLAERTYAVWPDLEALMRANDVYAGGQFVAVAEDGANRVMTSPDGVTWTLRTAASASGWYSVTYGNGTYVATAWTGTDRVMTSPDGITWTAQSGFESAEWLSVTFGDGLFVAVSFNASGDRVMTSPDGVTWTGRPAASAKQWMAVTYGNGTFVSVARFAGTSAVMTSSAIVDPVLPMAEWLIIHQALPMPASDTCADVTDSDVAWGTGLAGGWTRGWEPWVVTENPDAPRGGWACVRTLVNTGGNRWLIGGSA